MQLKAGFFTNGIEALKTSESMSVKVDSLLEHLSYFDVDTNVEITDVCEDPAVAVIYNMVSRGTPTFVSQFVEDILSTTIGKTLKRISPDGSIFREVQKKDVRDMVFKALHIIDPRVMPQQVKTQNRKSAQVHEFLAKGAVPALGDYIWQLADTNCSFSNMFRFSKRFRRDLDVLRQDPCNAFLGDKCDLCFQAPYADNTRDAVAYSFVQNAGGIDRTDYITEESISALLDSINVEGRVIVKDSDNYFDKTEELQYFTQNSYFDILRDNYNSPLYNTEDGIEALQLALTPLAIARIQKVVLEAINSGTLSLMAKSWDICVIERDVPCAFLAFRDLQQHFDNLFALENSGRKFPNVKLEIFHTEEFAETELNLLYQGSRQDVQEFNPLRRYDLLIDISVLRRVSFSKEVPPTITDRYAVIRSVKSINAETRLLFNPYSHYNISVPVSSPQPSDDDCDDDMDSDEGEEYNEQTEALRFFLKNLFAKNDFLDGQVRTLQELLNGGNVLHISAPSTGKTLVMLLSAMLRPGYSIVLPPTIAAMDSQFASLRARKIHTCYYISPVLQNSYSRNLAVADVMHGKSLVTFVSPSLIHDPYIRNVFRGVDSANIPLYYIMLDEAQRISLQTPDYKAYYQDIRNIIARNFADDNISMLRIGAFTNTMESNIQNEIAEKLGIDTTVEIQAGMLGNTNIVVHEVGMQGLGNTDDLAMYSRKMKQAEVARIIQPMISKGKDSKAIILSAIPPYDAVDTDGEPVSVCGSPTSHYIGDIDDGYTNVNGGEAYRSMKQLADFCNGDSRILSATNSAGLGVHAAGIRNIIHMEPPMSLDAFCRANGRSSGADQPAIHVLINTTARDFVGQDTVRDTNGNLASVEQVIATDFDTAATLQRLMNQNPGVEKEKAVIHEILDGVMFPQRTDCQNIEEAVFNEFNVEVEVDAEPMVNPHQLYIYMQGRTKSLGYIDFKTRTMVMPEMQYDRPLAEKVQAYVYDIICDNNDDPLRYLSTMEKEFPAEENDGIQTAIDAIMEGKTAQVMIPFANNSFHEAAELIQQKTGKRISPVEIKRCYNSTINYDGFIKRIQRLHDIHVKSFDEKSKLDFSGIYQRFRNRRDTLRAVARLKEIEVIDDYLVNQASGMVTVRLTKHNKDFYRMKLLPILQRNLTRERMLAYVQSIEEEKFLSMEKYSNVLIDFFYSEIYPLYQKQAQESSKFFQTILEKQKADTLSKESIRENLQNYFTQRYKCRFVYDEQMPENTSSVDKVVHIIDRAGSNINELLNLQESIDQTIPENRTAANKIIFGYCKLFTHKGMDSAARYDAYSHISDGLAEFRRKHDIQEFNKEVESITEKISSENYDLKDESQEVLQLQIQHNWLKWFNSEVLCLKEGRV
ncbi:MAG: DEAD/DEAH box helicase [Bacteroidales bacterium]|nr:DEAD/DEAH box helicase [Bacteroidales bacterium]